MTIASLRGSAVLSLVAAVVLAAGGCNTQTENKGTPPQEKPAQAAERKHGESGWCDEHGLLEEECSMCSATAAENFKKKGDWCKEHNRADSQCFICHPELEAKAAARYEALYGKKMPKPTDNTASPEKEEKK
jgi:hypothetical protein